MNCLTTIILIFSVLGALDKIFGNRFGLGKEFDKAFMLLGTMTLSMIGMMGKMDKKGIMLNSAFAVSGAFILGSHLAFTMAFDSSYVLAVIVGKLVSSALAIVLSNAVFNMLYNKNI